MRERIKMHQHLGELIKSLFKDEQCLLCIFPSFLCFCLFVLRSSASISQLVSQSVSQPVSQPVSQSDCQLVRMTASQSYSQPVSYPAVCETDSQPASHTASHPICHSLSQSVSLTSFHDSCEIPQLFAEIHYFLTVSALLCCRVHMNAEIVHQVSRAIPIGRVTI